jgi:hypothetical protein
MGSSVRWLGSAFLAALLAASCSQAPVRPAAADEAFLDDLEERTFRFFWERANPANGLVPDRWPTPSFSSIAAVGFGLTALPIGVERGYVERAAAAERALVTLRFFASAPQGPEPAGRTGHRGFFYHFVDMETGRRFERVELSSIDTTLFLAGALTCQRYFDRDTPAEREIRELADALYRAVDWSFLLVRPPLVAMGWTPEEGFHGWDWKGYDEAMLLYLLALGSPTHPIDPAAWKAYHASSRFETFEGEEHFNFSPLFGHHYTQAWVDFRGLRDGELGARGLDYFENTRRATLAQHRYAVANPGGFVGYGADHWGLTACDGPFDGELEIAGRKRTFRTYAARGASTLYVLDDGTISPSAAAGSMPFAPELVLPALRAMKERHGEPLYGRYGFLDAFNPTLAVPAPLRHGRVIEGVGWYDTDYLGIDQGILLVMLENHRSGLVWRLMRESPYLVAGLERAGFQGGWLAARKPR